MLDRVELAACNHAFHSCCLAHHVEEGVGAFACPLCRKSYVNGTGQVMVRVYNASGVPGFIDIMDDIERNRMYRENPLEELKHQFLGCFQSGAEDFREFAEECFAKGLSVNSAYSDGITALMMCAGNGDVEQVKYLLEKGADKSLVNDDGADAMVFVEDCRDDKARKEIMQLLK
ncbi:hypothetical protein BDR26DRAFT_798241 [Obelidium mucronatum]|nr:hypothetical protein BDR26DRAFT_798241 [Obelidium mucronatum]